MTNKKKELTGQELDAVTGGASASTTKFHNNATDTEPQSNDSDAAKKAKKAAKKAEEELLHRLCYLT